MIHYDNQHCTSLCFNNFSSESIEKNEELCLKRCFNKSLSFVDYYEAEKDELHIIKDKEFFNYEK